MVSMTFVTPSPSHFDLLSDLNCWCERVHAHVCLRASPTAAWQQRPREAPKVSFFWFYFFLHHHAPSCSLTFTCSHSVSVSSLFLLMLICSRRLSLTHWQSVTSPHIASLFCFLLKSVGVLGIKLQSVYQQNFIIFSHRRRRLTVGKFESRSENILFLT